MSKIFSTVLVLLILIGVFGFLWKNKESLTTRINIDYKFWEKEYWTTMNPKETPDFSMEAGILILVFFALGSCLGGFIDFLYHLVGAPRVSRKQKKRLAKQQDEIEDLKRQIKELEGTNLDVTLVSGDASNGSPT